MTVDEMANREARRADILRILNHQVDVFTAIDEINLIRRDLEYIARKSGFEWALIDAFLLGRICGIRQERARRAKKAAHNAQ